MSDEIKKTYAVESYSTNPPQPIGIHEIIDEGSNRKFRCLFKVIDATKEECDKIVEFLRKERA